MKRLYVYGWKASPCLMPSEVKWKPDKRAQAWCIVDEYRGVVLRRYVPPPGYKRRRRSV